MGRTEDTDDAKPTVSYSKHEWRTPDGRLMPQANLRIEKYYRDILLANYGQSYDEDTSGKRKKLTPYTVFDPEDPFKGIKNFEPGPDSPICQKCKLCEMSKQPYQPYQGAEDPIVSVVYPGITNSELKAGGLGRGDGGIAQVRDALLESSKKWGFKMKDVRWVPLTRCPVSLEHKLPNLKARGRWCRHFAVRDLQVHEPKIILAYTTQAFGLLNYKGNADLWHGKITYYRGWPDEWLTKPKFARPMPHYCNTKTGTKTMIGHPLFGKVPENVAIPMVPIRSWGITGAEQNPLLTKLWRNDIIRVGRRGVRGIKQKEYLCEWYRWTENPEEAELGLRELLALPAGLPLCYDTETTGLRPWISTAAIVSMMFRWVDPETKEPRSLGFPWDFKQSPLYDHVDRLKPLIWKVLTRSTLIGHHLTFDVLYTYGVFERKRMPLRDVETKGAGAGEWINDHRAWFRLTPDQNRRQDARLCQLADAAVWDTWHMAYTADQSLKGYSLDVLAHDHAKHQRGYEEEMELLIRLYEEFLHPKKGGHYLDKPPDIASKKWNRALQTYVMGDVETTYTAFQDLKTLIGKQPSYRIPLAAPGKPGRFRYYGTPDRAWVYEKIMSPASRLLIKMMGRGMFVDFAALEKLEVSMPVELADLRDNLKGLCPKCGGSKTDEFTGKDCGACKGTGVDEKANAIYKNIKAWCDAQQRLDSNWELDLENAGHLKEILFAKDKFAAEIYKFTVAGKKIYGEDPTRWRSFIEAKCQQIKMKREEIPAALKAMEAGLLKYASVDKFTLNKVAADNKDENGDSKLKCLQDYKKLFKLYSTYVRPLRNIMTAGLDKNDRKKDQHLCLDSCIHASFMLTGTRGGRLSCRDPNLQQLPRDGKVKQLYRSRFGKRGFLYQADLSQIELRLMAAACGDPTMIKAYQDSVDLHSLTASRIFKVPYEHFTKEHMKMLQGKGKDKDAKGLDTQRNIAKTVNFLTGYGGGSFGLQNVLAAKSIYLDIKDCDHIINLFFDSYPALRDLLSYYKGFIEEQHVAVSMFGRVRPFPQAMSADPELKSKALRAGCNHLIQSTASDMMLVALMKIEELMREANLESLLVSTVHDSLLIDGVQEERDIIHDISSTVMDNFDLVLPDVLGEDYDTSWMIVPFTGDYEAGHDYLHMRKVPKENPDWDEVFAPHVE